jgi:hypothetical protein
MMNLFRLSEVLETAVCTVKQWCERTNLSVNPNKIIIISFTGERNIKGLTEPILFSKMIQLSSEVKYLGLTLDKELTWKKQLDTVINKAHKSFWICRGTFWKTWGLKPMVIYCIYTAVVSPIATYAASVWWTRVKLKPARQNLVNCKGWPAWGLQKQWEQLK